MPLATFILRTTDWYARTTSAARTPFAVQAGPPPPLSSRPLDASAPRRCRRPQAPRSTHTEGSAMKDYTLTVGDHLVIDGTRLTVLEVTADGVVFGLVEPEDT